MPDRITVPYVRGMRHKGKRSVWITAYDCTFAAMADAAGVDVVLVGDSVANVLLGYPNTIPVTMADMLHHTRAARRGITRALLASDMPFGSYETSVPAAVEAATELMKAGAEAIKLEGDYTHEIAACVRAGIPMIGHLGMTPQSIHSFGGHRVQGKGAEGEGIIAAARRVEDAGAFAIVLELIPAELASRITESVDIPTIGIGAGAGCSGQVQVLHDVLGLSPESYRHARAFVHGRDCLMDGLRDFVGAVRDGAFPTEENSF